MQETVNILDGRVDRKAERKVLGALLVSEGHPLDCRDGVFNVLIGVDEAAFTTAVHKDIYTAIRACHLENESTDPTGVSSKLREMGKLTTEIFELLYSMMSEAAYPANAEDTARTILELHQFRELGRVLSGSLKEVLAGPGSYHEVAAGVSTSVSSVVDRSIKEESIVDGATGMGETLGQLLGWTETPPKGLSTGFTRLDEFTGGLRRKQMWVVAGRPGQGKTVVGLQMARHVVLTEGVSTLFISMEMPRDELFTRAMSAECNIRYKQLMSGALTAQERERVVEHWEAESRRQEEGGARFIVDDEGPQTVGEIFLKTRKAIREHNVGLVVVDYIQEGRADTPTGSSTEDVSAVSKALRALARKLNIPVLALAQLNRGVTDRADSRPRISDLKQSGQIEQDANVIVLIDNPSASDTNNEGVDNSATFIIGKNRNGKNNVDVDVRFDGDYARFIDGEKIASIAQLSGAGTGL
ncbi:replicative DNA helicase [Streptomyces sp. NPDC058947]|uniref:replicative DNA helicase n=1 Tax=Streptomyces sp. NPDC058947 TaxID=3346675 RepID=UPI0036746A15